jgi:hypothetical protein
MDHQDQSHMDHCANHQDHVAIESCELCERPLCALCLWYSADGRRLCEDHAKERQDQGDQVYSPAAYAEAVHSTLADQARRQDEEEPATYKGNRQDVNALISAGLVLTALFSCCGGVYCLPVIALILGAVAYVGADKAFDPSRTRRLAGVGLGASALMLMAAMAFIGLYIILLVFAVASSSSP